MATFIDFSKAFDSIDRSTMWKILRHYGVPRKIVSAISCMYEGSVSRVNLNGRLSHSFEVTTGVLQGDTLAPFLFIVVLDYVLKESESEFGIKTHIHETST